jgi:hypothetical protein
LNLRPPGYEPLVATLRNAFLPHFRAPEITWDQLRSPRAGKSLGKSFT